MTNLFSNYYYHLFLIFKINILLFYHDYYSSLTLQLYLYDHIYLVVIFYT